jgi:hypothetical protein
VVRFGFGGRDVPEWVEQTTVVEPVHPSEICVFVSLEAAARTTSVDGLGLEQTVDLSHRLDSALGNIAPAELAMRMRPELMAVQDQKSIQILYHSQGEDGAPVNSQ